MKRHSIFVAAVLLALALGFAGQRHVAFADSLYIVNTTKDAPDIQIGDGLCATAADKCSLRAAIQEANFDPDLTTIQLKAATYTLKIAGALEDAAATGDLDIVTEVEIKGVSRAKTVINANTLDRAFDVKLSGALTLRGLTIKNGYTSQQGGAINAEESAASVALYAVTISGSRAVGAGGGVALINDASIFATDSTFSGNKAPSGGALYIYDSDDNTLLSSTFSGNEAESGGAVTSIDSITSFYSSVFKDNRAKCPASRPGCVPATDIYGGALYGQGNGLLNLVLTRVEHNSSSGYGGGLALWETSFTSDTATIANNTARFSGGGLYLFGTSGQTDYASITGNRATAADSVGGGVTLEGLGYVFQNTTISGNSAKANGGGVYLTATVLRDPVPSDFNYVTIAFNKAANGGGIFQNDGDVAIHASIVSDNKATVSAPDCGGTLTVTNSLMKNTAGCTLAGNTGNITGESAQLQPLGYGIHGQTLAHVPAVGSAALGAVDSCTVDFDQYGDYRYNGFPCTMGAVEASARNLLVNPSFESGAKGWKITSRDGKDKVTSAQPFSGKKAFLFAGKPGKTTVVTQTIKKKSVLLAIPDGDSLCASGMFYTADSSVQNLTIQVSVKYSDGQTFKESNPVFLIDEMYVPGCSGEIYIDLMGGTRKLKQAQIRITSTSPGGKTYLDGVSLTWYDNTLRRGDTTRGDGVLPLPVAPGGFRGGD